MSFANVCWLPLYFAGVLWTPERQPGIWVVPPARAGHTHPPPQSMHVLFPIYATSFVMITSAKPAHSESSPISPASGKELAVWGNACATSVFSVGVVTGAVVSGVVSAARCGGVSTDRKSVVEGKSVDL